MKLLTSALGAGILACAGSASALTVETLPTHNVFYAGVKDQACLRLKVTAEAGESIISLTFSTANGTQPSDIKAAHLYSSGTAPFFSPNTKKGCASSRKLASSGTASVGTMTFSAPIALSKGDNYLWLAYDINSHAKGGNCIAADCLSVTDGRGGMVVPVDGGAGDVTATVFPFKYRIAPYYRPRWIEQYNAGHLNASHFRKLTDFIFYAVCNDGTDIVPQEDMGAGDKEMAEERLDKVLEKVKEYREEVRNGDHPEAKIILGFKEGEELADVLDDENRRDELAGNLAAYILKKGFDGVNICWKYPREEEGCPSSHWNNLGYFMASLRERLAGTGATISLTVSPSYDLPPTHVLDQADYICTMSYDVDTPAGHSPMAVAKGDVCTLDKIGIPKAKVVLGLPFHANSMPLNRKKEQIGYKGILSLCPNMAEDDNTFVHPKTGKKYSFNGATLIKEKCKFVVQQGIGGVMVWGYDSDTMLTNARSLAKAMYSVIKQTKR